MCLVFTEPVPHGYTVRWTSGQSHAELAEALRKFYRNIKADISDESAKKLFSMPGVYPIFEGNIANGVQIKIAVGNEESEVKEREKQKHQPYASLDNFMENTPSVAAFFEQGYRNDVSSVRIVTPYCDMFIEQYGKPTKVISIMTDNRLNLANSLTETIRASATERRKTQYQCFPSGLSALLESVIQNK